MVKPDCHLYFLWNGFPSVLELQYLGFSSGISVGFQKELLGEPAAMASCSQEHKISVASLEGELLSVIAAAAGTGSKRVHPLRYLHLNGGS